MAMLYLCCGFKRPCATAGFEMLLNSHWCAHSPCRCPAPSAAQVLKAFGALKAAKSILRR